MIPMQQGQQSEQGKPGTDLSPEGLQIVHGSRLAMTKPGFRAMFDKGLKDPSGPSFAAACAAIVFALLNKGQDQVGKLDSEELYSDGGVGDVILDFLFQWAKHAGYKEASDPDTYDEALDLVENMGVEKDASGEPDADQQGGPPGGDPNDPGAQPGNAPPPPVRGGLMAV